MLRRRRHRPTSSFDRAGTDRPSARSWRPRMRMRWRHSCVARVAAGRAHAVQRPVGTGRGRPPGGAARSDSRRACRRARPSSSSSTRIGSDELVDRLDLPRPRTLLDHGPADLERASDEDFTNGFLKPTESHRHNRRFGTKGFFIHSRRAGGPPGRAGDRGRDHVRAPGVDPRGPGEDDPDRRLCRPRRGRSRRWWRGAACGWIRRGSRTPAPT